MRAARVITLLNAGALASARLLCMSRTVGAQELPRPRWVTAVCRDGENGPVRETEIRENGEIHVRASPRMRDTLIGRDSAMVMPLLEKARTLPWTALRSQAAAPGRWCMLMATWRQARRGVKWYGDRAPSELNDVVMIHGEIERLGGSFYDDQPYLESSCSGGFTGGGGGSIVTRDGRFYHWQRQTYASPQWMKFDRRDSARAAMLFAEAERIGFLRTDYDKPSNMSCSLSLVSGAKGHTVTWPINGAPRHIRAVAKLADEVAK